MKRELQLRLEEIYRSYPRHLGKSGGMNRLRTQCTTEEKLNKLSLAVENYKKFIIKQNTEAQYVLYWSTFANQWKDWLDPEHGKCEVGKPDLKGIFD